MKLLSMNEVCEIVGCNYPWLRWEVEQRKTVTPLKVGCSKIFNEEELAIIKNAYKTRPSANRQKQTTNK
jgi:hypothetical protein